MDPKVDQNITRISQLAGTELAVSQRLQQKESNKFK